jgi:hypothetical protein
MIGRFAEHHSLRIATLTREEVKQFWPNNKTSRAWNPKFKLQPFKNVCFS